MAMAAVAGRTRKQSRINVRVTDKQKNILAEAAQIETEGDLSKFILNSAEERAQHILRQREETVLSAEIRERFYDLLLNPPEPSEALKALFSTEPSAEFHLVH
jgi:uncharacterized protein (DUF1778 family)